MDTLKKFPDHHRNLKVLTFGVDTKILHENRRIKSTVNSHVHPTIDMQIHTLGLINCHDSCWQSFLQNKYSINDILNLTNSLRNLTICLVMWWPHMWHMHMKSIENVLQKKYYYNLQNVNILIKLSLQLNKVYVANEIDRIVDIFKTHKNVLKQQFTKLNVGFYCKMGESRGFQSKSYYV